MATSGSINQVPVDTQPLGRRRSHQLRIPKPPYRVPGDRRGWHRPVRSEPGAEATPCRYCLWWWKCPHPGERVGGHPSASGRDGVEFLDEAQHLALFKMGRAEFQQSIALHKSIHRYGAENQCKIKERVVFLRHTGNPNPEDRQEQDQEKFAQTRKEVGCRCLIHHELQLDRAPRQDFDHRLPGLPKLLLGKLRTIQQQECLDPTTSTLRCLEHPPTTS